MLSLALGACGTDRFAQRPPAWADTLHEASRPLEIEQPVEAAAPPPAETADRTRRDLGFYRPGSGVMVAPAPVVADARPQEDGDVKLNFQNANLLEVIKVVLGDMLGISYTVDPSVQGTVSMQTTGALRREDLIPTLELLLRMNNAALITSRGVYRIVPLANAMAEVRAPQLGDSTLALPGGFSVRVVPLRYVAAEEMAQILEPFISGSNQLLRVDSARNLLILAGNASDMDRLLDTVKVFDVDRMAGMSVALFTPEYVDAATLAADLEALLSDPQFGLMAGLVRFIVVERLNGLMVVTPRAEHLARVREWIQRLDRDTGDASPRLFIYRVQNGKATDLAEVLGQLFSQEAGVPEPSLAPGLTPATIGRTTAATRDRGTGVATAIARRVTPPAEGEAPAAAPAPAPSSPEAAGAVGGIDIGRPEQVQVIADEPNNALLILARGTEYRQILAALKQLDVSPLQVLVEVTIAEVTLKDNLSYGVEWFFKNKFGGKTGEGLLDLSEGVGIGPAVPGFSYTLRGGDGVVQFVINTLAEEGNLSIISSPSLLVLNNQEATINVGEEVPLTTQQATSTSSAVVTNPDEPSLVLTSTVEYRDTGVLLKVKPRVNAGGLVIMEVEQEVSTAPSTSGDDRLTPRITKRKIASTVAVDSGNTIILGGLIRENRDRSESGIPGFHKIPILGALFGTKSDNQGRTELIVLITPRAVSNGTAALQITDEYRRRLQKLIPSRAEADAVRAEETGSPAASTAGGI
jgi:general secretion pathway protein D